MKTLKIFVTYPTKLLRALEMKRILKHICQHAVVLTC